MKAKECISTIHKPNLMRAKGYIFTIHKPNRDLSVTRMSHLNPKQAVEAMSKLCGHPVTIHRTF